MLPSMKTKEAHQTQGLLTERPHRGLPLPTLETHTLGWGRPLSIVGSRVEEGRITLLLGLL